MSLSQSTVEKITPLLQDPIFKEELVTLIAQNDSIDAIKLLKKRGAIGLKEGKAIVDNLRKNPDFYNHNKDYAYQETTNNSEFIDRKKSDRSFLFYAIIFLMAVIIYYFVTNRS